MYPLPMPPTLIRSHRLWTQIGFQKFFCYDLQPKIQMAITGAVFQPDIEAIGGQAN